MAARKSKKQAAAKKTSTTRGRVSTTASRMASSKTNIRERELVLIDMALAAGAGLGEQVHRLPLAAVEYWAEYFSGTVKRALRSGQKWAKSRDNARTVGERMGRNVAAELVKVPGDQSIGAKLARDIAHDTQLIASGDDLCSNLGGAGKFC